MDPLQALYGFEIGCGLTMLWLILVELQKIRQVLTKEK